MKRIVIIENPARLSILKGQLRIEKESGNKSVPIEDVGIILIDNRDVTITVPTFDALSSSHVALIICGGNHMPVSVSLPIEGHVTQQETLGKQLSCDFKRKRLLWQTILIKKYDNQKGLLRQFGLSTDKIERILNTTKTLAAEGAVAKAYFKELYGAHFIRDRDEKGANALLNYGYTVMRAAVTRGLVCAGLYPGIGVNHHNRYDAFVLADDIMEPFRPFVDGKVKILDEKGRNIDDRESRAELVALLLETCHIGRMKHSIMDAIGITASSLAEYMRGERDDIIFPSPYEEA